MVQSDIQGIYGASAIPSVEGIEEFRVQTNAYTAEYGRSGGGQVTMLTKSGAPAFDGSAFEFLRNSAMDSKNFFLNRSGGRKASFQQHQYGASTGGPVKKDMTFFFALFEKRIVKSGSFSYLRFPQRRSLAGTSPTPVMLTARSEPSSTPSPLEPIPIRPATLFGHRSRATGFLFRCSIR